MELEAHGMDPWKSRTIPHYQIALYNKDFIIF